MVVAAAIFLGSGCSTFREKPHTALDYEVNAILDTMSEYPQTRGLSPGQKVKPVVRPASPPASISAPAGDVLALHYSFDCAVLRDGKVPDESGGGHDGIVFGAVLSYDAERGKVYYFNGTNSYILAGDLGSFPEGTISFWMKAEEVKNWRNPFTTDYANWDSCIRFEEYTDEKFVVGALGLGTGFLTSSMKPMTWYHVAYAWDGKAGYGYFDGKAVFETNHPDPGSSVHPNIPNTAGYWKGRSLDFRNVAIGNGYSTDPMRYWKGWVDDVRIYGRALNENEVSGLYEDTVK